MNLAKIKWKKCAICFKKSSIKYLVEFLLKDEGLFYRSFDLIFEQYDNLESRVHTANINTIYSSQTDYNSNNIKKG